MAILDQNGQPFQVSQAASDLLGPLGPTANQLYASDSISPGEARTAVNDLFGATNEANTLTNDAAATQAQDTAQAQAMSINQQGDQQETASYLQAAGVADTNARLARVSGQLQQYQESRQIYKTISGQQADIAGAGFASAGSSSALFLGADSAQQGALELGITGANTAIQAGAYETQADAARAEAAATNASAAQAGVLSDAANAAATLVAQNAASQGQMLTTNALNNAMSLLSLDNGTGTDTGGVGGASNPADPLSSLLGVNQVAADLKLPGGSAGPGGPAGSFGYSANPWMPLNPTITTDLTGTDPNSLNTLAHRGVALQPVRVNLQSKVQPMLGT